MDVMLAMLGDIEAAAELSKNSELVQRSKKSPRYKRMMEAQARMGKRSGHLSESELATIRRKQKNLFSKQLISKVGSVDDLTFSSEETIITSAILNSGTRRKLHNGELSICTDFTEKATEIIKDTIYSGTSGCKIDENGKRSYVEKSVHVGTNVVELKKYANLTQEDRYRAISAAAIVASAFKDTEDEDFDPYSEYVDNTISKRRSNLTEDIKARKGISGDSETEGRFNWRGLL